MNFIFAAVFVVLLAFVLFLAWGFRLLRRHANEAHQKILQLDERAISPQAERFRAVLRDKLDVEVSFDDPEAAAQILDHWFCQQNVMQFRSAFAERSSTWDFAVPTGAFLGELLRRNGGGKWVRSPFEEGGLALSLPRTESEDGELTVHPFDKVLKQAEHHEAGELRLYVQMALGLIPLPGPGDSTDSASAD